MEVVESSTQQEDESAARPKSDRPREEAEPDPRGFHELAFLGQSNACEAEPELEERDVGPEFDSYEDLDGDKLRLLDRWVGCETGRFFFSSGARGAGSWSSVFSLESLVFVVAWLAFLFLFLLCAFCGWNKQQRGCFVCM